MKFNEARVWIAAAAKRKDVNGLIRMAVQRRIAVREAEYLNLLTLIALENDGLWREVKEYEALTWSQFLERIDVGYSIRRFDGAVHCLNRFGEAVYMKYGYDILRLAYGYADRSADAIEALDVWVEAHNYRLPSTSAVVRILHARFGVPPVPFVVDNDENEWKERFESACLEIADLRKELEARQKALRERTREVNDLKRRNSRLEKDVSDAKEFVARLMSKKK